MPTGGSSPAGNTTVTQVQNNPTQQAQLPFLTGQAGLTGLNNPNTGWNQAVNLAIGDPFQYYPGQTLATNNPAIAQGYGGLINSGFGNFGATNAANSAFLNGVGGGYGVQNSPAYGMYQGLINGANAPFGQISNLSDLSTAARNSPTFGASQAIINNGAWSPAEQIGGLNQLSGWATSPNGGTNQLAATANGSYLNGNPYLDQMFNAASNAVTRQYQTATAPQTDSNFEAAGRYGSGAMANARGQNELNLGQTLNNLASNIYGTSYANERGLQTSAAGTLGSLVNQGNQLGQSALANAGNLNLGELGQVNSAINTAQSGYLTGNQLAQAGQNAGGNLLLGEQASQLGAANGLQSGYQAGNTATNQALLMEPNILSGNLEPNQAIMQGGQGLTSLDQAQIADAMQRFYGVQQAPWQTNAQYLTQIGQPTSGSISGSTTTPYFQNQLANILGAGTGALGLYNGLKTATGGGGILSGIFGPSIAPATGFDAAGVALPGVTDFAGGGDLGLKGAAALGAPVGV